MPRRSFIRALWVSIVFTLAPDAAALSLAAESTRARFNSSCLRLREPGALPLSFGKASSVGI